MQATHQKIVKAPRRSIAPTPKRPLTAEAVADASGEQGYLQRGRSARPVGPLLQSELYGPKNYDGYFTLSSAGPDGKWDTRDDLTSVSMYGWKPMIGSVRRSRGGVAGGGLRRCAASAAVAAGCGGQAGALRDARAGMAASAYALAAPMALGSQRSRAC